MSVINAAPLRAVHRMIRGQLILSRDDGRRFRCIERVLAEYLDLKPIEERMIDEVLRGGV
ncbi:MAG: hypothetical protein QMD46_10565 [Methanomicrobiales archaeon]|nr:hypothetical protein [Methanomicrobiales archaeon]MDI6876655.1 hypothetical protein [Methanomicrobiales archaeon]